MAGTIANNFTDATNYDAIDCNLQPPSKFVTQQQSVMKSEIELALVDVGIVTKTDVDTIVESHVTKSTSTIQLQIVKAFKFTI